MEYGNYRKKIYIYNKIKVKKQNKKLQKIYRTLEIYGNYYYIYRKYGMSMYKFIYLFILGFDEGQRYSIR